ncbi:MAG TPA: T9SS type A sorting domain-containing protein, partial [Chitinophagales bacterium]|nr:T9SS type A sorting domain-containing protein [Chitinophagales bacterium]
ASEMNSSFFDVERSYDVVHWELIGSRQAAGVSTHPLTYRFTDERPFTGVSYYRLRSVDADGSHRYSQIESVDIKRANANGMFVYPTPTSGLLNVRVDLALPEEMELNVYSSMGHLVMRAVVGVSPGKSVATLDLSTLPNGSYTIRARGRGLNGAAYVIKTD